MTNVERQPTKLTNEMLLGEDYLDRPRTSFGVTMTVRDAQELDRQLTVIRRAEQRVYQDPGFYTRKYGSVAIMTQEGENDG